MSRKKILWLCSWYPGKLEPFNGDFIQRHAQAAALYNDIYVIHVYGDASGKIANTREEIAHHGHLTEHMVYFRKPGNGFGKILGGYRWLNLMRRTIRHYMRKHGRPDAVHVHIPMKAGIFGSWMKRRYGISFALTEHWGIYNEIVEDNFTKRGRAFQKYTRDFFEQASIFTTVSNFLGEGINRLVTRKDWIVIPNVVNTGLFHYSEEPDRIVFRFIHVSNMIPLKNPEGILRAFRNLLEFRQDAELVMAGDKNPGIRQLAKEMGMEEFVRFTGEIAYAAVAEEMKKAHCLVLFSNIENSPCVINEALCCGLPVVATQVGGIPELVNDSNGLLVQTGDEPALTNAMLEMMREYSDYDRKNISDAATQKFSYPVIGKQFDGIYDKLKNLNP